MLKQFSIRGFSMIEVLVTMAITTVGLLGLSSLQLQSMRATQDTGNRSQAIWIANDLKNRIKSNEIALRNNEYVNISKNNYLKCSAMPSDVKVCSAYHSGSSRTSAPVAPAACSAAEMALYDVWHTLCGTAAGKNGVTYKTSSADFISNPELKITKAGNGDVTLALRWDSQTSGYDQNGNKTFTVANKTTIKTSRQQSEYGTTFRP